MRRLAVLLLLALLWSGPALADDNRPLGISVHAAAGDAYRVKWKVPANVEARHLPALASTSCTAEGNQRNWSDPLGHWREEMWHCVQGIVRGEVSITYPFANPNLATILRFHPDGGAAPRTLVLQPQVSTFTLAEAEQESGSFLDFVRLGIEHIWIGIDHLLFVAGLIFIARTPKRVLVTITGFTITHSITLALSTLDLVRLPIAAIEGVIALSIVFLAVEIAKGPRDTLTWRTPVVVASSFGLLHGFGFAAVLREIGIPADAMASSLLAFNLGIELGQVVFATLVLATLTLVSRKKWPNSEQAETQTMPAQKLAGYSVGILASFWMVERVIG